MTDPPENLPDLPPASQVSFDPWTALNEEGRRVIQDAEEALAVMVRTNALERWITIGAGVFRWRLEAEAHAGTAAGSLYQQYLHQLGEHVPHLASLDYPARTNAVWMFVNREVLREWYATVSHNRKLRWRHATTLRRVYDSTHVPFDTTTTAPERDRTEDPFAHYSRPQLIDMYKEAVEENALIAGSMRRMDDTRFLSAEQYAKLLENRSPGFKRRLIELLQQQLDDAQWKITKEI